MHGIVSQAWRRIIGWLQIHAPTMLPSFAPPAKIEDLNAASEILGVCFTSDFVEFYQLQNGFDGIGLFPSTGDFGLMAFSPMPLSEIVDCWQMQTDLVDSGEFEDCLATPDDGIAGDWWNRGWIPFACNGAGDYYCLDNAPTASGLIGQVISHSHESPERRLMASSLGIYLTTLADWFESSKLEVDDEYGVCFHEEESEMFVDEAAAERNRIATHQWRFEIACRDAEQAFRAKNYPAIIELLKPFESELDKTSRARLNYARKMVGAKDTR